MTEENIKQLIENFNEMCEKQDCKDCKYNSSVCQFELAYNQGKKDVLMEFIEHSKDVAEDLLREIE